MPNKGTFYAGQSLLTNSVMGPVKEAGQSLLTTVE